MTKTYKAENAEDIWGILCPTEQSHQPPWLVISVIGDSKNYTANAWNKSVFETGLIETAKGAKECWIIYICLDESVSNLVQSTVKNYRKIYTKGFDRLENQIIKMNADFRVADITLICIRPTNVKSKDCPEADYVFGVEKEKCQEINMDLLDILSNNRVPNMKIEHIITIPIPVVVFLVEGNLTAVHYTQQILSKGLPVVIIQGSGKAADTIAEYILAGSHTDLVKTRTPILFGRFFKNDVINCLENKLFQINENKDLISLFNTADETEQSLPHIVMNSAKRKFLTEYGNDDMDDYEDLKFLQMNTTSRPSGFCDENGTKLLEEIYDNDNYNDADKVAASDDDGKHLESKSSILETQCGSIRKEGRFQVSFPKIAFDSKPSKPSQSLIKAFNKSISQSELELSVEPIVLDSGGIRIAAIKHTVARFEYTANADGFNSWLHPSSSPLYFLLNYQLIQKEFADDSDRKRKSLSNFLKQAIIADKIEYVATLLEDDKSMFLEKQIGDLYQEVVKCRVCTGRTTCHHVFSALKKKSVVLAEQLCYPSKSNHKDPSKISRKFCRLFLQYPNSDESTFNGNDSMFESGNSVSLTKTYQNLLLWSLFACRKRLGKLFWSKCADQLRAISNNKSTDYTIAMIIKSYLYIFVFHNLATALLATSLLKRLSAKGMKIEPFTLCELKKNASLFENRTIEMITYMYKEDSETATYLMEKEFNVWGIKVNPLQCAYDSDLVDIIAHKCMQKRLKRIWCNMDDRMENKVDTYSKILTAPRVRFYANYVFFILGLYTFSAAMLTEMNSFEGMSSIGKYEWCSYIWIVGDMIEEYMSHLFDRRIHSFQSWRFRFRRYISDFWNALDTAFFILILLALCLRFSPSTWLWARRVYSISLLLAYMRLFNFILIFKTLGIFVILIKEMLKDMLSFGVVLFIFMMAFGVIYHANMYPDHSPMWPDEGVQYWRIWRVVYLPYWQIYGDFFLSFLEDKSNTPCTRNRTEWTNHPEIERCVESDWIVILIAAFYVLLSNLLLVNLVIALFSARFEKVRAISAKLWRYNRYSVIMDYRTRYPVVLNLIIRPFEVIYFCVKRIGCCRGCGKHGKTNDDKVHRVRRGNTDLDDKYKEQKLERMKTLQSMFVSRCS